MKQAVNPLLTTVHPFPFDQIKAEQFVPAIETLIQESRKALQAFPQTHEVLSYENTVQVFLAILDRLGVYAAAIEHFESTMTTPALHKAYEEADALQVAFHDELFLHDRVYQSIKVFSDKAFSEGPLANKLNEEQGRALEQLLKQFRLQGAELADEKKKRLREINSKIAELHTQFTSHVTDSTFNLVVEDRRLLQGLPEDFISAAGERASSLKELQGKKAYVFNLDAPVFIPFMQFCANRDLRRQLYVKYMNRGSEGVLDNTPVIEELLQLRQEKAQLLGYKNYAALSLARKSAGSPETVITFLNRLADKARTGGFEEFAKLEVFAKGSDPALDQVRSYDWAYYSEKYRESLYHYNESELRDYFELKRVMNGLFQITKNLYALDLVLNKTLPTWHPDVKVYEVREAGQTTGILYLDLHPRSGMKRSGAWQSTLIEASGDGPHRRLPVAIIVCNFTEPTKTKPALLSPREVETLFHEFGHALHGLLSRAVISFNSMESVAWDVIEFPSHFMESWALEKETLQLIARHYKTEAPIPTTLLDKLVASKKFQAFGDCLRQISFSLFDLQLHREDPAHLKGKVNDYWRRIHESLSPLPFEKGTHFENGFQHLFNNDAYSAGYYSYKWSELLAADAFEAFRDSGDIFNQQVAMRFRKNILEMGNLKNMSELYLAFRGRAPREEALIRTMTP